MNEKIRAVSSDDLRGLSELFNEYRVFYGKEPDREAASIFLEQRIVNSDSEIFVAENEMKSLIGFVQLYPLFSSTRMKKLWLLNDLYVAESHRGSGISVLLIDRAKSLCIETDACGMILETAKTNGIGNNLYIKTEFSLDAEHNFYSWDNQ